VIFGRSDTTLNPGGVRIGTAEIYRGLSDIDEIVEAAAVARRINGDEIIVLFVILVSGAGLDQSISVECPSLREHIKQTLRSRCSPRHVPREIYAVDALPRTKSGKVSEVAIRNVINGNPLDNTTALANPDCLKAFSQFQNMQSR